MPSSVANLTALRILNQSLNLTTGTIDAHLVTAIPPNTASTGADLTPVAGGSYAPQSFTLASPASESTGAKVVASVSSITYTGFYAGSSIPVVGVALTRRASGSYSSSDPYIDFLEFTTASAVAGSTSSSASNVITTTNSFSSYSPGQYITGLNIPADTIILAIPNSTTIHLNKVVTTGVGGTVAIYIPAPYTPPTAIGNAIDLTVPLPSTGLLYLNRVQ